jgi:soluble lytic murein transglycosylase-like protein
MGSTGIIQRAGRPGTAALALIVALLVALPATAGDGGEQEPNVVEIPRTVDADDGAETPESDPQSDDEPASEQPAQTEATAAGDAPDDDIAEEQEAPDTPERPAEPQPEATEAATDANEATEEPTSPAENAPTRSPADTDPDDSWRVRDAGPPIQVTRAVEKVTATARSVAESHGRGAAADNQKLKVEDTPLAQSAEKLRRFLKLDRVSDKAKEILQNSRREYLVMTPYVADPRWEKAMQLLKDDDCKEALKLATEVLGEPEDHADGEPAVRYAFGRIQMCAGQASKGRKTLESIVEKEEGAIVVLARRRLGLPDGTDSAERDEGKHLYERIRHARKNHEGADETVEALQTLREELDSAWYRYKVDQAIVDVYEDAGRYADAGRHLLGVYRVVRDWRVGDDVEDQLERLQKRAGLTLLPFGERVDRMRDLIARGKYRKARQVSIDNAKLAGVAGKEIEGWSFYRRALQAERQRDREEAAEMFEKAEKLVKDPDIRPRLYFGWARALRRLDRDREAIGLYETLCDEYQRHHLCDDAIYEAGRLSQYLNDHQEAREKFAQVVGLFPDSDKVADALWRGAFSAYLLGDYEGAQAPLEHIIAHYPDEQDASELTLGLKASYWLGVSLLKDGDEAAAADQLQKTVDRGPLTWYGRLAVARLEAMGEEPVVSIPDSRLTVDTLEDLTTLRVPKSKRLEVAAEYVRLGLYEDAIEELRDQVGLHPAPKRAHQMLAGVYLADGQPDKAHWMMKSHIEERGPTYHTMRDWGTAFPIDYMELAHKYGTKYNVSPFLVQAIIRQESGFRPKVSSYAGAMGLMQLMPGTARYTQRQFARGGHLSRSDIVDPEQNVKLGTMYIRIHTAFAADRVPLALAGYNAGPAPLESWFGRYGKREVDAWVESITYREARGYVRKVFTSYVTYAGLYGSGELPDIQIEMPEEMREWGDVPEVDKIEEGEPVSLGE